VPAPVPKLAGFTYTHIAALGAEIVFTDFEPKPEPLIHEPEDIDRLRKPHDYLAAPFMQTRLKVARELKKLCPEAPEFIGHQFEGPVTTAVLLMGESFLLLPYDQPARAHRLLQFCTASALEFAGALSRHFNKPLPGDAGFPDDFAGLFEPRTFEAFVVPYWEQLYRGMHARQRSLHSELLRVGHLRYLKDLRIDYFDPGVDQYLPPEVLRRHCPTRFQCRITEWQVRDLSATELQKLYGRLAEQQPYSIMFQMTRLQDEAKIRALLESARERN
jgi:uroporphyrinogen-III decarboxylase